MEQNNNQKRRELSDPYSSHNISLHLGEGGGGVCTANTGKIWGLISNYKYNGNYSSTCVYSKSIKKKSDHNLMVNPTDIAGECRRRRNSYTTAKPSDKHSHAYHYVKSVPMFLDAITPKIPICYLCQLFIKKRKKKKETNRKNKYRKRYQYLSDFLSRSTLSGNKHNRLCFKLTLKEDQGHSKWNKTVDEIKAYSHCKYVRKIVEAFPSTVPWFFVKQGW